MIEQGYLANACFHTSFQVEQARDSCLIKTCMGCHATELEGVSYFCLLSVCHHVERERIAKFV